MKMVITIMETTWNKCRMLGMHSHWLLAKYICEWELFERVYVQALIPLPNAVHTSNNRCGIAVVIFVAGISTAVHDFVFDVTICVCIDRSKNNNECGSIHIEREREKERP